MNVEHLKKIQKQAKEKYFPGRGGGLILTDNRPSVVTKKEEKVTYKGGTVNYVLMHRALIKSLVGEEPVEKEGHFSLKVRKPKDVVLSFYNSDTGQTGSIAYGKDFKSLVLLDVVSEMKNTVDEFLDKFEARDGNVVKLLRRREKVFFSFGPTYVEIPLSERIMLHYSLKQFFVGGEVKPFLGTVIGAENKPGTEINFGIRDYIVPVNKDVAVRMLAII